MNDKGRRMINILKPQQTCAFTAHRPSKLYGYNIYTPKYYKLGRLIRKKCINLIENQDISNFISGGALGGDTISFLVINKLKGTYPNIKNILAVPFRNQPIKWINQEDTDRYNHIKTLADKIIYVDTLEQYKLKGYQEDIYYPAKMQKRNEFMVDNCDILIAVWDGSRGGTYNCIKYCEKQGKEIIRINPKEI